MPERAVIDNIITRMWFFRISERGFFATGLPSENESRSGKNFTRAMLDAFGTGLGSDGKVERTSLFLDGRTPEPGHDGKSPVVGGIRIRDEGDAKKFFRAWERWTVRKTHGLRPSFVFIREKRDAAPLSAFVAGSCIDLVFASSALVDGWAWLWRDTEGARAALSSKAMPTPDSLFYKWKKWASIVGIVCGSPRFLLVQRNTKLGLYTLGAEGDDIRRIASCGMIWNRDAQAWTGDEEKVDRGALVDIVQRDSLPSPAILGYVPEWSSLMPRPRSSAVEEERSEALVEVLFG